MNELVFDRDFLEDLAWWVAMDRKTALKIFDLIEAIRRDPTSGLGKPEPLKHLGSGTWSRRITQEHRLVYRVAGRRILFAQARYHYDFFAQALSKLERGHARDLVDVHAMLDRGLIDPPRLLELFEAIRPALIRYPGIDIPSFSCSVYEFCQAK